MTVTFATPDMSTSIPCYQKDSSTSASLAVNSPHEGANKPSQEELTVNGISSPVLSAPGLRLTSSIGAFTAHERILVVCGIP